MYSRFSKLPSLFVENYESILVVMTILGSEIRRGKGVNGNCHSVARALATIFPNFRVADGYVYSVSPPACDETHGPRSSLINEIEKKPESVRFKRLCHSWLVWTWLKQDTNLIIDAWPIGGGYGFSPPVAHFQDGFDMFYVEAPSSDLHLESLHRSVEECHARIEQIFELLAPETKKAA